MEQVITSQGPSVDKEHGYFAAISVTNDPEEISQIFKDQNVVEKILKDLPVGITNFLSLEPESVSTDRIVYRNTGSLTSGTLTFIVQKNPYREGSIISAEALLDKIHFNEEGPSTLMNIFLKRCKNLIETGEIPTTKGQPSGREELKPTHH